MEIAHQRFQALFQHMRINLRRAHQRMPQKILHRPDIVPRLQQMRRSDPPSLHVVHGNGRESGVTLLAIHEN